MNIALTKAIQALAEGLGFDAWGIAAAHSLTPLQPESPASVAYHRYLTWLSQGKQAGMQYLSQNPSLRMDPSSLLPGAQSLLLVLQSYFHTRRHSSPIAQYAWGEDYHISLRRRLQIIADYLARHDAEARPFVDTAPLLEKAWAIEAGLGWLGKNTLLLNRQLGSYTFIGGVVTTASLLPDAPFREDLCGTCNRCIEACPTHALTPYELDARRCIAYWTIEAPTLEEGMPPTHGWIFGCDICQQVCPWNRFAKPQGEIAFRPKPHAFWSREQWSQLSKSQLRKLQKNTALRRSRPEKLEVFLRSP
ncbi:MAG: tRNA epoxyqueuosine(34) reductase QueG [Bacteroidia bacterium]|nr:tRNA epoxyqueuosine(34) reductase QueG [Bacteroidia bacterium]